LTIEELIQRINMGIFLPVDRPYLNLPKSEEHRRKLSEYNKKYMMVTDGNSNIRILKNSEIPVGFRRGMTRRKNGGLGRT